MATIHTLFLVRIRGTFFPDGDEDDDKSPCTTLSAATSRSLSVPSLNQTTKTRVTELPSETTARRMYCATAERAEASTEPLWYTGGVSVYLMSRCTAEATARVTGEPFDA